ncbi:hypothetical protein [Cellulosimicrobium sp. 22601]|uniref:hypothetical protein n=1 Tax=unclassified Cellulosimicrobium TaxID=2624466 RepID=UPI003F85DB87
MSTPTFAGIASQGLDSPHFVTFSTPDGQLVYVLSGVVLCTFGGGPGGGGWHHDTLTFDVPIPDLPARRGLRLRHWAPFVTLNTVANDGEGDNIAFGVDSFSVTNWDQVMRTVQVAANLAVRDIDGFVLRVGYRIDLLGSLEPLPSI